jgi:hypothetical protein
VNPAPGSAATPGAAEPETSTGAAAGSAGAANSVRNRDPVCTKPNQDRCRVTSRTPRTAR